MTRKRKNQTRYLKDIIDKRYTCFIILIIVLFGIVTFKLFQLQILNNEKYKDKLAEAVEKNILGSSSPRGRIYDRNYNLIVDNEAIKTIYYKKISNITIKEELELSYTIANMIEVDYSKLTDDIIKDFWLKNNEEESLKKITENEWEKLEKREITSDDIYKLKLSRVTENDLSNYQEIDKEASYIYYLMNKGYSYAEKTIKNENVTEEEYAKISENINSLKGFNTKLDWQRIYLYGDTFKSILGRVSNESQGIPKELKDYYINLGYALNDRVGISYLELQYENYLKGSKAEYKLLSDNTYKLVKEGSRGNDIVLSIDINLQKSVEEILANEVLNAKNERNTEYYDSSYVIIQEPNTGEIIAMAGKQVITDEMGNKSIIDCTQGIIANSVTPGSVVKGASMSVGYKYKAINIGTVMQDECIKIKSTPEKCSWKSLGTVNDISALAYSSNSYQFKIAIKVGGGTYKYNQPLQIDTSAFEKYRDMYASYGLGLKTKIDLPNEKLGYIGTSVLTGHLLDFSIGQYDTYTPIQLSQYITTMANTGVRVTPHLLKEVYAPSKDENKFGELVYKYEKEIQGKVDLEDTYIKRIQEGFHAVMSALGRGYMGNYSNSAGKTGTSQSFIDTDSDGVVDTETITQTFGGYAPYNNPVMSIMAISPNVSHTNSGSSYSSGVNKRISSKITNKFFEIMK